MNTREYIKEEGRQEGRRERDREIVLNMLKEKADIAFISEVMGLSEEEITLRNSLNIDFTRKDHLSVDLEQPSPQAMKSFAFP